MLKKFVLGIFDREEAVVKGAQLLQENKISVEDIFTPYPIHALEKIMGLRRSWLPIVCFLAGVAGCTAALGFQIWAASINWPLNVGGKPFNSLPAFIPITFEVTVLLAGLITTAAFLARSKLFPLKPLKLFNQRVTDDRFLIVVKNPQDEKKVTDLFYGAGAVVVESREERE